MRDSRLFIDAVVGFVAVRSAEDRAEWERVHDGWGAIDNWEHAMFDVWRTLDPRDIHLRVRAYIDEWIDTGFRPDGSEMPNERAFAPTSETSPAVRALRNVIERIRRNPNRISLGSRGGIIDHPTRGLTSPTAEILAEEAFYEFYRSEWLYRIMRCNRCKVITLPDRKPRERYERGWHCAKCRKGAAAQAAVDARRAQFRKQWFALAVRAYRDYTNRPRRSTNDVSAFLTDQVNRDLSWNSKIKRNTITRNLREIQARAGIEPKGGKQ